MRFYAARPRQTDARGKNVLTVCHGGICRFVESCLRDMGKEEFSKSAWATARSGSVSRTCPKERGGKAW